MSMLPFSGLEDGVRKDKTQRSSFDGPVYVFCDLHTVPDLRSFH